MSEEKALKIYHIHDADYYAALEVDYRIDDLTAQVQRLEKARDDWKMRYESSQEALTEVLAEHTEQSEELDVLKLAEGLQSPVYEQLVADRTRLEKELEAARHNGNSAVEYLTKELAKAKTETEKYHELQQEVNTLREALKEFIQKVESGEIRSLKTYQKFKALLAAIPSAEEKIPDWVRAIIHSSEFKASVKEGLEDIKAGRTRLWPEIAEELGIPTTPSAEEVEPECKICMDKCCTIHATDHSYKSELGHVACPRNTQQPATETEVVDGVHRYKKKPIMRWLADAIDLNDMWVAFQEGAFIESDFRQFYRDIGYSLGAFEDVWDTATETVCPCNEVFSVMNDKFCTPCWEACYSRRRHINCTTPGCNGSGKIQVEESTNG